MNADRVLSAVCMVGGAFAFAGGIYMVSVPAAWIVAGLVAMVAGVGLYAELEEEEL